MANLFCVAGLGNPGNEYARSRHNAGFLVTERLAGQWERRWRADRRFSARVARWEGAGRRVLLFQPLTFMNASGEAVQAIVDYYRIDLARLLVVVDDADLAFGQMRMRPGGSSGGHHGLESIERHLRTRSFARLRLGIGRENPVVREITDHVLGRFTVAEQPVFDQVVERACDQITCWLNEGIETAMSRFNGAAVPPQ